MGPDAAMMMEDGDILQLDLEDAPEDEGSDNATQQKEIHVVPSHGVPGALFSSFPSPSEIILHRFSTILKRFYFKILKISHPLSP